MNDYTIEATGLDGWMSYRYQYKTGVHDFLGTLKQKRKP